MKQLLISLLILSGLGFAQQVTTIKGPEHPELIPDEAAAIAVFGVHSDTADTTNTEKHHAKLQLVPDDHAIYDAAMATFRQPKSRGNTYNNLIQRLSPNGQAKLRWFIQSEKAHMQYQIHPPQQHGDMPLTVASAWTLYFAENITINEESHAIIITPQVSISGDDGGYCPAAGSFYGFDIPSVMLHGNPWQVGPRFVSGGESGGGSPVQFVYTFPNVTLTAAGETVDLSYASHVEGECSGHNPSVASDSGKSKTPHVRLASF